ARAIGELSSIEMACSQRLGEGYVARAGWTRSFPRVLSRLVFRPASLSHRPDRYGPLGPAAAAHAVLRGNGGAGVARGGRLGFRAGAQVRRSSLPQKTETCARANS